MTHRKLLTADTRATEIISGVSLIIIAMMVFFTGDSFFPAHLMEYHIWQFWGVLSGIFGTIQILAILLDDCDHIRAITSWFAGTYWIWSGSYQLVTGNGQFYDVVILVLGVSCMYAFIINLLITVAATKIWK